MVRPDVVTLRKRHYKCIAGNFVAGESTEQASGDKLAHTRWFIRRDAVAVSRVIRRLTKTRRLR